MTTTFDQLTLGELLDLGNKLYAECPDAIVRLDINHNYQACRCHGTGCRCMKRVESESTESSSDEYDSSSENSYSEECESRCNCATVYCDICEIETSERTYWTVTNPHSWRGLYKDLAFDCVEEDSDTRLTLQDFIKMLSDANGTTYGGYHGGSYTMHRGTPVWISWNESSSGGPRGTTTAIVDLTVDDDCKVIIVTKHLSEVKSDCVIS